MAERERLARATAADDRIRLPVNTARGDYFGDGWMTREAHELTIESVA